MIKKIINSAIKFSLILGGLFVISNFFPESLFDIPSANAIGSALTPEAILKELNFTEKLAGISSILQSLSSVIYPVLVLIGYLLDNEIILNPQMSEALLTIWSQVRDLVNYVVLFILLYVLLYNVVAGSSESNYSLKKNLKDIAVTLVVVNLSYYGGIFVLDASNVLINISYSWVTEIDAMQQTQKTEIVQLICKDTQKTCENEQTKQFESFIQQTNKSSLPMVIAVKFGKVHKWSDYQAVLSSQKPTQFVALMYVKLILAIIQLASFVILACVLFIRLVVCWIYLAMSPLIVADKFLTDFNLDTSSKLDDFFVQALYTPIKMGVGLTLSFIFLDALTKTPQIGSENFVMNLSAPVQSLGTFQEFIILVGSIVMMYEVGLNVNNNEYANALFSEMRSKISGFATSQATKALDVGSVITGVGGSGTGMKEILNNFLPSDSGTKGTDPKTKTTSTTTAPSGRTPKQILDSANGTTGVALFSSIPRDDLKTLLTTDDGLNALKTNSKTKKLTYGDLTGSSHWSLVKGSVKASVHARLTKSGDQSNKLSTLDIS